MKKFDDALEESRRALSKKTRWRGLVMAFGIYFPGFAYISATVYGATLVAYEGLEYKTVFLYVLDVTVQNKEILNMLLL